MGGLPADGAGVHHIVAGHRRRAAAESAGLNTVPCLVRDFSDEADVVLSMIAENTQRSDGLNIVDEAQALAAVIDLRGGAVTARKLAAAVGHREGWVRARLGLLCLPDNALDALHAGKISLDVATALTVAVEHPELIDSDGVRSSSMLSLATLPMLARTKKTTGGSSAKPTGAAAGPRQSFERSVSRSGLTGC